MKIIWKKDPRVHETGYWATAGIIKSCTEDELALLTNFLNSFLEDWREVVGTNTNLLNTFCVNGKLNRVYISFQHAQSLLNFFDTMGWTYHIRGE